jgi:pyruvate,water dikinase
MTAQAPMIVWVDEADGAGIELLGGKLASLVALTEAGFDVPPAFAVTTEAFAAFARHNDLASLARELCSDLDCDDLQAVEQVSARLADAIAQGEMPPDLEAAVGEAYRQLEERSGIAGVDVAVRSSGVNEDLEGASFAGQYDTYLWIRGVEGVLHHIRRCWAGLFGPSVLTYRPQDGVPAVVGDELPGMGVAVQQMIHARSAGVMFTLDPLNGDRSKIVIEACWGLGEGVVKGDITPDRFRVDKVTMELLRREISTQTEEYGFVEEAGEVGLKPVDPERGAQPCLEDPEVVAIAQLGKRIERHRGAPQDLEWAVDQDGAAHLLQARPETVWSSKPALRVAALGAGTAIDRVLDKFVTFGQGDK